MWAPELHNVNGRYIVYYVARSASGHPACGAAVALTSDPFGPYLDTGRPLVTARDRKQTEASLTRTEVMISS